VHFSLWVYLEIIIRVPTMMISIIDNPKFDSFDKSSLRTGVLAGSTCPITLMHGVVDKLNMKEVTIGYGMTETSPASVVL
jgi:fatty-acyl-CoA synthase